MRAKNPILVILFLTSGCYGYGLHEHWIPSNTDARTVSGFVLNPVKTLPLFITNQQFTEAMLSELGGVAGVRICVAGAEPENCSEPSAPGGAYQLSLEIDGEDVELYADVSGAAETFLATYEKPAIAGCLLTKEGLAMTQLADVTKHNFYVIPPELFAAVPVASPLEKGAGLILSQELERVGGNFVMPGMIDVDASGASQLFAVRYDEGQPGGMLVEDLESVDADAPYSIAMAIYVADGSAGDISIELADPRLVEDPQHSKKFPLYFEGVKLSNQPGTAIAVRPPIPNAQVRLHGSEFDPPVRCN